MIFKKDSILFGCIIGLLAPVLGVVLFKYIKLDGISFKEMFDYMLHLPGGHSLLSAALSVSLVLNLVLLTAYLNMKKDQTSKGIFAITVVYAVVVLLLKKFG